MTDRVPVEVTNLDRYGSAELPWSRPHDLLASDSPTSNIAFFLGTSRPDGRPHAAGIGALWLDGDLYFTSGPETRKARNLATNPACTISVRLEGIDLILEGEATRVTDQPTLEEAARLYREGGWPAEVEGEAFTAPFSARAPVRRPGTSTASPSIPPSASPLRSRTARHAGASTADGPPVTLLRAQRACPGMEIEARSTRGSVATRTSELRSERTHNMAEHNNDQAGNLPKQPHPALKQFDRLIGDWHISGPDVEGTVRFAWMEGGFFLIQQFDLRQGGGHYKGIEYTGFDEDTGTLRSRLMGTDGSRFMYTYGFESDTMYYWFGEKGSENYSVSTFSADGNTITGRWQWPNPDGTTGGYTYTLERQQA